MEFQPTEILEHIFRQIPCLHTIKNCSKTSLRWGKIIENIFNNKGMYVDVRIILVFIIVGNFLNH